MQTVDLYCICLLSECSYSYSKSCSLSCACMMLFPIYLKILFRFLAFIFPQMKPTSLEICVTRSLRENFSFYINKENV